MSKIIVSEFLSLDGVMEAPHNWHFPYISDDMQAQVNAQIHTADAFLYGRLTYEEFASFWPSQTQNEFGIADKLNQTPKFVVSSTLQKADWNNSTVIQGNAAEAVGKLKRQSDGIIGLSGSATLIQTLMQADLIDEYQLFIHPVVVGSGKRLFQDGTPQKGLKLLAATPFSGGVILCHYQRA